MALALLEPDDHGAAGKRWFRYEIGDAPYFRFAAGGPERRRLDGVSMLGQPRWMSPIEGPLPPERMGRGRYGIDESVFGDETEFVQMMSYRTAQREGPAVSRIVRARPPLPDGLGPPVLPLSRARPTARPPLRRPSPARLPTSLSFMDILSAIGPAIGRLLGGLAGGAGPAPAPAPAAGTAAEPNLLARLADPATIRLLQQLVSQIAGAQSTGRFSTATSVRYSEAQIAPALLAALPALAPLLQQVLNPQTIQTLVDAPNRGLQTVINGVSDFARLGLQADQQLMDHLRQLNPGVDDPALDQLVAGLSRSASGKDGDSHYRRTSRVRLAFPGLRSVTVAGLNQIAFVGDRAWTIPVAIELPVLKSGRVPRLREVRAIVTVKDHSDLKIVARHKVELPDIAESGPVAGVTLPADKVRALQPDRDWLLCVTLTWRDPKGGRLGAAMSSLVRLLDTFAFDSLEEEGEAVDLHDPAAHRALWHKLWAGRFAEEAKRFDTEVDYRLAWRPDLEESGRDGTQVRTRPAEGSVATVMARVRGRIDLSPRTMAALASDLDPSAPPAEGDIAGALDDPALAERMALGARARLTLRGRPGEAFALWAYPTVRRARLRLARASEVLDNGNVATVDHVEVPFAVPVALNLVGTRAR